MPVSRHWDDTLLLDNIRTVVGLTIGSSL
ncbi:hypothetical protein HCR18_00860 [Wolbachia pipientis]|nr:hypothetical protein [Wolbachia pipientis]MBA8769787.1 hypothetical protein [Wolbachia pipientis]